MAHSAEQSHLVETTHRKGFRLQARGEASVAFYDEATGVIVQTVSLGGSYHSMLPPGRYHARVGLFSPVHGYYQVYDVGGLVVSGERRWDIDLGSTPTAVTQERRPLPEQAALEQNFPNPFNATTTVRYQIEAPGDVELRIYNTIGQVIRRILRTHQAAGTYTIRWHGRDDSGRQLGSGVYLYRLLAGEKPTQTRKLVLLR